MNKLLTLFLLSVGTLSSAQIDLDSLKLELEKTHIQVRGSNNWNAYIIKYLNKDSLTEYTIPFDREGNIDESIFGIAMTHYEHDEIHRHKVHRYYDKYGKLHFGDWPPIIVYTYNDSGQLANYAYYVNEWQPVKQFAKTSYIYNKFGDVVEERKFDYDTSYVLRGMYSIERYAYKNDRRTVTKTYHDSVGNLSLGRLGYYMEETTYKSKQREIVLETRYLDQTGALMDVPDRPLNTVHAMKKYIYDLRRGFVKIELYNAKGELVSERWTRDKR